MSKGSLRKVITPILPVIDILISPFVFLSSVCLFALRKMRLSNMRVSKWIFKRVGVFPVIDHCYEPLFNDDYLSMPLDKDRSLPGIQWNDDEQLSLLDQFNYQTQLGSIPYRKPENVLIFYYDNPSLGPADAEYLYCMIRHFKPARVFEIGSGYSTLMARHALEKNKSENNSYDCDHVCIGPYEMPWLENLGVKVMRKLVEEVDISFFKSLANSDILFIDSSHMIRPQGDVLYEFLQILPTSIPALSFMSTIFFLRRITQESIS